LEEGESAVDKKWFVYLLLCRDQTLYCGITDDVQRRLEMHRSGKGAKYTRGRGPLELVYTEECESYSSALKREYAIKQLPRSEKLKLIELYKTAAE
jgi:putative endonuclease